MSFILDALRKSENERRIDSMPQVARVPLAVQRTGVPVWATIVIAVLSAIFVAFLASVWFGNSVPSLERRFLNEPNSPINRSDDRNDPAIGIESNTGVLPSRDLGRTDQAANVSSSTVQSQSDIDVGPQPAALADVVAVSEAVALSATPTTAEASVIIDERIPVQPQSPAFDISALPSIDELRAEGISIAPLDLQLHVSSNNRANRFVMINGNRYREGDRLAEGGTVDAIIEQGVVVRISGRAFLIPTD